MIHSSFHWVIDWLVEWLHSFHSFRWLVDWLISLSSECLVDFIHFIHWVTDWLIGWLIDFIHWLNWLIIDFINDWLHSFRWLIGWLIGWFVDWLIGWYWLIDLIDWQGRREDGKKEKKTGCTIGLLVWIYLITWFVEAFFREQKKNGRKHEVEDRGWLGFHLIFSWSSCLVLFAARAECWWFGCAVRKNKLNFFVSLLLCFVCVGIVRAGAFAKRAFSLQEWGSKVQGVIEPPVFFFF